MYNVYVRFIACTLFKSDKRDPEASSAGRRPNQLIKNCKRMPHNAALFRTNVRESYFSINFIQSGKSRFN